MKTFTLAHAFLLLSWAFIGCESAAPEDDQCAEFVSQACSCLGAGQTGTTACSANGVTCSCATAAGDAAAGLGGTGVIDAGSGLGGLTGGSLSGGSLSGGSLSGGSLSGGSLSGGSLSGGSLSGGSLSGGSLSGGTLSGGTLSGGTLSGGTLSGGGFPGSGGTPGGGTDAGVPGVDAGPGSAGGGGNVTTGKDPVLPQITGDCPPFAPGKKTMDWGGLKGVIFEVGEKKQGTGSLVFYWHGTGSTNGEYASMTMQSAAMADLKAKGGILVSPQSGTGTGGDCSGTGTFAKDDFKVADQIAACAVRDWNIDPHRIYTTGCSAGGLQAGCMLLTRSAYIAAAVPNSGGIVFPNAVQLAQSGHVPSIMTVHGKKGQDWVAVDFSVTSGYIDDALKQAGGMVIDCDTGGGHCGLPLLPANVSAAAWQFMQDHPFGVASDPYASGLPSSFPMYCQKK